MIDVYATQSQLYAQVCSLQKTLEIPVKVLTKFFRTNFIAFGALQMLDWPFLYALELRLLYFLSECQIETHFMKTLTLWDFDEDQLWKLSYKDPYLKS